MTGTVKKEDIILDLEYTLPIGKSMLNDHQLLTMEAILTRDQRTTSHRVHKSRSTELQTNSQAPMEVRLENIGKSDKITGQMTAGVDAPINSKNTGSGCFSSSSSTHMRNRSSKRIRGYSGYPAGFTITWLRLGSLLVTLLVASIHGAPMMTSEQKRLNSPRKWVNPCGIGSDIFSGSLSVIKLEDKVLLDHIVVQADVALMQAQLVADEYTRSTFGTDFESMYSLWKGTHYGWLPSMTAIPKELREPLKKEFLDKLDLDTALLDAYEYMQMYAVALEQVVWDRENLDFYKQFEAAEFKLRTVLCELQVAREERKVPPRPDVSRSLMLPEYREMAKSDTFRDLRDWLIFRDYMNGLEYVMQVFKHLGEKLDS